MEGGGVDVQLYLVHDKYAPTPFPSPPPFSFFLRYYPLPPNSNGKGKDLEKVNSTDKTPCWGCPHNCTIFDKCCSNPPIPPLFASTTTAPLSLAERKKRKKTPPHTPTKGTVETKQCHRLLLAPRLLRLRRCRCAVFTAGVVVLQNVSPLLPAAAVGDGQGDDIADESAGAGRLPPRRLLRPLRARAEEGECLGPRCCQTALALCPRC